MFKRMTQVLAGSVIGVFLALPACTVPPAGEVAERAAATQAGAAYVQRYEERLLPRLKADAPAEELVAYALLSNGTLEQSYWMWRSALEQVPQDGTQKTNVMLSFSSMITNGSTALQGNTLALGNDPMNNIILPNKLQTAAKIALENARAAARRFDQARFDLRTKVLMAYYDYALSAEVIRLDQADIDLLAFTMKITESRVANGAAMQSDLLKAANELERAKNDLATEQAKLPVELAAINALLDRPWAKLTPPTALPMVATMKDDGENWLTLAAQRNGELKAQTAAIAAKRESIRKAKQDFIPDFGVNVSTDLAGMTQSIAGSAALPFLRYQAINAEIAQAKADLRAAEAQRRQAASDLASQVAGALVNLSNAQRQQELYETIVLPRARQIVTATQTAYAGGQATLLDLLDSQRSLIAIRRMIAEMKIERARQVANLEQAALMKVP